MYTNDKSTYTTPPYPAPQGNTSAPLSPHDQAMQDEQRSLRKTATAVGIFVLIYYVSMQQAASLISEWIANLKIVTAENQTIFSFFLQIIAGIAAPLFACLLYKLIFRRKIGENLPKSFVKPSVLIPLVFLGMGAAMIANMLAGLFDTNISLFKLKNYATQSMDTRGVAEMVFYVISTAVVPALAEEFAFRGIVMGALRKYGDAFAILASALLFGAMHGNTTQIVFAFILGLIFAYTDCKANSILPSVFIHFLNNFYAIIEDVLKSNSGLDEKTLYLIRFCLVLAFCVLGILSYIYLAQTDRHFFRVSNSDDNPFSDTDILPFRRKIKLFMTSVGVIISMCLFFAEMVYYLLPPDVKQNLLKVFHG